MQCGTRILDRFFYYDVRSVKPEKVKVWLDCQTLILAPQVCPSNQTLMKNPQQLCSFLCQTLKFVPQQLWQTLNNLEYPKLLTTGTHNPVMGSFCLYIDFGIGIMQKFSHSHWNTFIYPSIVIKLKSKFKYLSKQK